MNEKQLHTPEGVRDILFMECHQKNSKEQKIQAIFHHHGFWQIETPTFEYFEVFSNGKNNMDSKQVYKFFNREGNILALRPDMTPPIARISTTSYKETIKPLRLCYLGNVFRYNETYQGKMHEFTQAGVEIIGIDSMEVDAEVLALSVQSLIASGLNEFQINIGNVDFFKGIVLEAGFDEKTGKKIRKFIDTKDYIGIEEIITRHPLSPTLKQLFLELPQLFGNIDILTKAKTMIQHPKAIQALEKLQNLYHILCDYEIEDYISFDLGMVSGLEYYTDIFFRGYTSGSGSPILYGGRYDGLLEKYGSSQPAVGFALITNQLLHVLKQKQIKIPIKTADTLLVYSEIGRKKAIKIGNVLRNQGLFVENSLLGDNIEKNIQYAKCKSINGIIYFKDENDIQLMNLKTGHISYTTISDLIHNIG